MPSRVASQPPTTYATAYSAYPTPCSPPFAAKYPEMSATPAIAGHTSSWYAPSRDKGARKGPRAPAPEPEPSGPPRS